jgi:hypothetical protein
MKTHACCKFCNKGDFRDDVNGSHRTVLRDDYLERVFPRGAAIAHAQVLSARHLVCAIQRQSSAEFPGSRTPRHAPGASAHVDPAWRVSSSHVACARPR